MPDGPTVANSSCIIALEAVLHLGILHQLYISVLVPGAVAHECGPRLPAWIHVQTVQNQTAVNSLRLELGDGEAQVIALAVEVQAARLILDDKKAGKIARQLQLPVTGTLAVLLRAKERGIIPRVADVIGALVASGFRLSDALFQEVLQTAGE